MVGLILISVAAVAFIIIVGLWVEGIDQMDKKYPEYKGWELYNEEEENEQD